MDMRDQFGSGAEATELLALTARVTELERMVAELRGGRATGQQQQPRMPERAILPVASPPPPLVASPLLVASPPPPLVAARGPAGPEPARKSLEDRLGSQVFTIVGIFTLICGAAYFLKLAIDYGWVGPVARVLIGLVAGAGLVVWSEHFRRRGPLAFSYALKAVGTGVLYLSLWAAYQLYALTPASVALTGMILVTAWNAWMAISQDAELLAGYALAGGLLTPLLLSTGQNHEAFLFTYLAALALGVVFVLRTRPWRWLLWPAFGAVAVYFFGWFSKYFHAGVGTGWNGESSETAVFALVFFAVFALPTMRGWSTVDEPARSVVPVLLPLLNAAFLAIALAAVFQESGLHAALAFVMVGLAALYLGVMRVQRSAMASAMYLAAAVVCLTVAVPLKASGHTLTTAWLVEGLVLYWAGTRFARDNEAPSRVLWGLSFGGYVLGLGSLLVYWGARTGQDQHAADFFSHDTAAAVIAVVTLGATAWLGRENRRSQASVMAVLAMDGVALLLASREVTSWAEASALHRPFATGEFWMAVLGLVVLGGVTYGCRRVLAEERVAAGTFILANLVALLMGVREIGALFSADSAGLGRALAISGFLMLYGAVLLAIGFVRRSAFVRWQALVLLVFTIGKVFLYDIRGLNAGYRVASLMGLGAVLLGVSYAYQKDWLGLKTEPVNEVSE